VLAFGNKLLVNIQGGSYPGMPQLALSVLRIGSRQFEPCGMRGSQAAPVREIPAQFHRSRLDVATLDVVVVDRPALMQPWNTRSFGPSDLTTLHLRTACPALTSTVIVFSF
jgi:hypothetical protein